LNIWILESIWKIGIIPSNNARRNYLEIGDRLKEEEKGSFSDNNNRMGWEDAMFIFG